MLKRIRKSIKLKSLFVIVLAVIAGVISYSVTFSLGEMCIEKFYSADSREIALKDEFQKYVTENKIKSSQSRAIQKWCREKKNVYCLIFNEDTQTLIDSENIFEYKIDGSEETQEQFITHRISFSDTQCDVEIVEYSDEAIYTVLYLISYGSGFIVMIAIILYYLKSLVKRITVISNEASAVSKDINHPMALSKKEFVDEIDEMGLNIENMRKDIISHYEKRQEAFNANRELITNMSHDIRTPLTSIIGYNEMMLNPSNSADEMRQYAELSLSKAQQLKNMSERLFKYSLVYNDIDIDVNKESYDASLLFQQIIGEQIIIAKQNGFTTQFICELDEVQISTDVMILKRIFDNLFSNINKYADKSKLVKISIKNINGSINIMLINYIDRKATKKESTMVGKRSVEKLIEALDGKVEFFINEDVYVTEIVF